MSQHLNRLAQTQAIVAQVEREIAEKAKRQRSGAELILLQPLKPSKRSLAARTADRLVLSLFPAGI
jgi:hypothetical protein